jgi:probable HAF family extracellular repeat protein
MHSTPQRCWTPNRIVPATFCAVLSTLAGVAFSQPVLVDPGELGGYPFMNPGGLSADGNATAGIAASFGGSVAFRWTRSGGLQALGFLPGATFGYSDGNTISADGSTIVGRSNGAGGTYAFRWRSSGGMQNLGAGSDSEAFGVNADGSVIVGRTQTPDGVRAFRWTQAGGVELLGVLPGGFFSIAGSVSADGNIVVGNSAMASAPTQPFVWTPSGGMVPLGVPAGASQAFAGGISADGTVIVGFFDKDGERRGFRWTSTGGYADLGTEITPGTVSADGQVVVGRGLDDRAAFWHPVTGVRDLQNYLDSLGLPTPDRQITLLDGVSADGSTVAGGGYIISGGIRVAQRNVIISNMQYLCRPRFITQPASTFVCPGEPAVVSANAIGTGTITYSWIADFGPPLFSRTLTEGLNTFSSIGLSLTLTNTNSSSPTLTVHTIGTARNPLRLTAAATDECGTISSRAASISVGTLSITRQPEPRSVCPSTIASFSVGSSAISAQSFQWQVQDNDAPGGWRDIVNGPDPAGVSYDGANGNGLVIFPSPLFDPSDARQYRCVVSTACTSIISEPAQLTIVPSSGSVVASPASAFLCEGFTSPAVFTAAVVGAPLRWEIAFPSGTGNWSEAYDGVYFHNGSEQLIADISGSSTGTLSISPRFALPIGEWSLDVRAVPAGNPCPGPASEPARMDVYPAGNFRCSGCTCAADFDQSGGTPDTTDIDAYFSAWLTGDTPADADCSGGTPDTTDIETFFVQWLNGGC